MAGQNPEAPELPPAPRVMDARLVNYIIDSICIKTLSNAAQGGVRWH